MVKEVTGNTDNKVPSGESVVTTKVRSEEPEDPKLRDIATLAKELSTPSMLAGMMRHYGWAEGLVMTQEEFIKAQDTWLISPVTGKNGGESK